MRRIKNEKIEKEKDQERGGSRKRRINEEEDQN